MVFNDFSVGRFYAGWKFWVLSHLLALPAPALAFARTAFLLIPALAGGWMFGIAVRCSVAGALISVLWLATFTVFPGYQPFFSNPLLLLGLGLVLLSGGCLLKAETLGNHAVWRIAAVVFFSAALLMHEVFLPFLAVIIWTRMVLDRPFLRVIPWIELLASFMAVAAAYVLLYFGLKNLATPLGATYDGTEFKFHPTEMAHAFVRYPVSALPGFELAFNRTGGVGQAHFYTPEQMFNRTILHLRWQDGAVALVVALTTTALGARLSKISSPKFSLPAWCLTAGMMFIPSTLIALTPKYQERAHHHWPPYYYGGLGMPFLWLILGVISWRMLAAARARNEATGRWAAVLFALIVATAHCAIAATNRETVLRLLLEPFR